MNVTPAATAPNAKLPHDARVLLFRYRLVHGASFSLLGSLFLCGKRAARKAFWDVAMYQLMCDPLGTLPNVFNTDITDDELERFLLDVIARQSPGVRRLVARLRTPDGRQVRLFKTINILLAFSENIHFCELLCTSRKD